MLSKFNKSLKILGLEENADFEAIKSAYRKLVKIHHPDLYSNPENKEKASRNFKIITDAFDYLKENYIEPSERGFCEEEDPYPQQDDFDAEDDDTSLYYGSRQNYRSDDLDDLIRMIKDCIRTQTKIKITYKTSYYAESTLTERVIIPRELHLGYELNLDPHFSQYNYDDDKLYLRAYCELRKDYRTFRLDRIMRAESYADGEIVNRTKSQQASGTFNQTTFGGVDIPENTQSSCMGCLMAIIFYAWLFYMIFD